MSWAKPHEIKGKSGTLLLLYVQPGASQTAFKGLFQDRMKLSVQAPPVEGAANEAVIAFLAKTLKTPKRSVHLLSGETSRQKNIWVELDFNSVTVHLPPPG